MRRPILALLMAFLMAISALSVLAPLPAQASVGHGPGPAYTERGPISIVGDGDFTSENGVVGGSGTPDDPYIIEGWEISADEQTGIFITETTKYFIIRNCHIYSTTGEHDGIKLTGVQNCLGVKDCLIEGCRWGISIGGGYNLVGIGEGCTVRNCEVGIEIYYGNGVRISGCSVENCTFFGDGIRIHGYASMNITIEDCVLKNCYYGVNATGNIGNLSITGCRIEGAQMGITNYIETPFGWEWGGSITNLLVNGCSLEECVGSIWLGRITNASIGYNTIHSTRNMTGGVMPKGISLYAAFLSTIHHNYVSIEGEYGSGIGLTASTNITITYNDLIRCDIKGMYLSGVENLTITYNILAYNDLMGIDLSSPKGTCVLHHNDFVENRFCQAWDATGNNTWYDKATNEGNYWSDHTGPDADEDGIVDEPYVAHGVHDPYPLVSPVRYTADVEGPAITDVSWSPTTPGENEPVSVSAKVTDPSGVASVRLLYRTDTAWTEVPMTPTGGDYYEGTIPGQPAGTTVHFKIIANDTWGNEAETEEYSYTVGAPPGDTVGPSITDITISPSEPGPGEDVTVKAKITDPSGVAKAILSYSTDGGQTWTNVSMTPVGGDYYQATIPGQPKGTTVVYMIMAQDGAGNWATTSVRSYTVEEEAGPAPGLPEEIAGIPTMYIVGGAVAAVVVIGVAIALLKRRAVAAYPPPPFMRAL